MKSYAVIPVRPSVLDLFPAAELLFWGLLLGVPTALVSAYLQSQELLMNILSPWTLLITLTSLLWTGALLFFLERWAYLKNLRFRLEPLGLTIGWNKEKYRVSSDAVEEEVNSLLSKLPMYADAAKTLRGCVAFFQEPDRRADTPPDFVTRKVTEAAGNRIFLIGWRKDLRQSALQHELAHHILNVCAHNPSELEAHAVMRRLGI